MFNLLKKCLLSMFHLLKKKNLLSMFNLLKKKLLSMFNLLKKNVCYQCSTYWKKCLLSMFHLLKTMFAINVQPTEKNVGYQCSTYWKNCFLSIFNLMKKMFTINGKPAGEFSMDWSLIVIFFQWVAQSMLVNKFSDREQVLWMGQPWNAVFQCTTTFSRRKQLYKFGCKKKWFIESRKFTVDYSAWPISNFDNDIYEWMSNIVLFTQCTRKWLLKFCI